MAGLHSFKDHAKMLGDYQITYMPRICILHLNIQRASNLQMDSMTATVGQSLQPAELQPQAEIVIAEERHLLSVSGKPEELRIVLTRPLVQSHQEAVLEVGCGLRYSC